MRPLKNIILNTGVLLCVSLSCYFYGSGQLVGKGVVYNRFAGEWGMALGGIITYLHDM